MIPIPDSQVTPLNYDSIHDYRSFSSDAEELAYINLLRKELRVINSNAETIRTRAGKLRKTFQEKPNNPFSKRCCNFIILEEACKKY